MAPRPSSVPPGERAAATARAPRGGLRRGRRRGASGAVRQALLLVAALAALVVVGAGPAAAHDALTGSDPADGASVPVAPERVRLEFAEAPVALGTKVRVTGPDGTVVSKGAPTLDGVAVVQAIAANRPAGRYTVDWRVTSADGHPISGTLTFAAVGGTGAPTPPTVTPAPTPTPTPTVSSVATTTSSADPARPGSATTTASSSGAGAVWLLLVGALALLALVVTLTGRRRQERGPAARP